jgi:hypothetical protein
MCKDNPAINCIIVSRNKALIPVKFDGSYSTSTFGGDNKSRGLFHNTILIFLWSSDTQNVSMYKILPVRGDLQILCTQREVQFHILTL